MWLPLRLLLLNVLFSVLLFQTPTSQALPVALISKDKSTSLFTISVSAKTPLRPTKLYLDLGFLFPWMVCDATYNSSSFHTIPCGTTFCADLGFGGLACDNCTDFGPPDPNCVPSIMVCGAFPENPVTRNPTSDEVLVDTLALPTTDGTLLHLPNFTFSCVDPTRSTLLKGLPKNVTGLATLARSNLSLQAQISPAGPNSFALCFPSSSKAQGVAIFSSIGPFYASLPSSSSKIDLSDYFIHTPLLINPVATGDTEINYAPTLPSPQHFIGLTSIQINGNSVPINQSLLTIHQDNGFGGTKISTATPYTVLESSIHRALTELFVKEASSSAFNLAAVTAPAKPFNVCYHASDLTMTRVGPLVPTIDLVLHAENVYWRILGANSMVRVKNKKKGLDLWCLGFVDGGISKKTPITIGGKQIEDNVVEFDLESNMFGVTSSLLSHSLTCPDVYANYFPDPRK